MKLPTDYQNTQPMNSVTQKSEAEIVMRNIVTILARTKNEWRDLDFNEYRAERLSDGYFTPKEEEYFNQVIDYAHPERIGLFAPAYNRIWKDL